MIGFSRSLISLFLSKTMAKAAMRVQVITAPRTATERWLVATVNAQADRAGIGHPEVGIFDHPSPNAFATGWNHDDALIAVSTGLLDHMGRGEVEAVLAQEVTLAHRCRRRAVTPSEPSKIRKQKPRLAPEFLTG